MKTGESRRHTIDLEGLARLGGLPFAVDVEDVVLQQRGIVELATG